MTNKDKEEKIMKNFQGRFVTGRLKELEEEIKKFSFL